VISVNPTRPYVTDYRGLPTVKTWGVLEIPDGTSVRTINAQAGSSFSIESERTTAWCVQAGTGSVSLADGTSHPIQPGNTIFTSNGDSATVHATSELVLISVSSDGWRIPAN
jgi:mannose-6-phosphate isomerase-like protein (cupin superfamily)